MSKSGSSINLDDMPVWDFTVEIGGVRYPMVSPLEAQDVSEGAIPAQGELDARLARKAGVFVRVWRWLFGQPRLERSDIPTDGGAAHTRAVCVMILGEHEREMVESMSTAKCAQLVAAYMACQEQWLVACAKRAGAVAGEAYRDQGSGIGHQGGSQPGSRPGMTTIKPGTFPFEARRHPNLMGGSEDPGSANRATASRATGGGTQG